MVALSQAVPVLGDSGNADMGLKKRWWTVVQLLQSPYEFSAREWSGLR